MYKILTLVGTRPEIIKLSLTIKKLDNFFDHYLVHTGQNYDYELNQIFFKDLNIRKPDYFLSSKSKNSINTIAKIFVKFDLICEKIKPDAVVILGDTNSSLAAIVANKKKIPIFHIEAGNRCFNRDTPEELNRKLVDHTSDINLTYTQIAKDYLIKEGIPGDKIIQVGSPMLEILNHFDSKINKSKILQKLRLIEKNYILVSMHREENVDNKDNLSNFIKILENLSKIFKKKILFSTHQRTEKNLKRFKIKKNSAILFSKPLSFTDYSKLQKNSFVTLSDSGTIVEESSILNFNALNLRDYTERLEGMNEGSVMMVGVNKKKIIAAIRILQKDSINLKLVNDYNVKNFSSKIPRLIISYLNATEKKWR
jgi:UDP-N-acetylglucosamine 2-epimerase (non-hydrolysing)